MISAKPFKKFSYVGDVVEGEWASFSCNVKSIKCGTITWKIGDYTSEQGDSDQQLPNLEEIRVRVKSAEETNNTETIEILATMELDGLPVQCKVTSYTTSRDEYSQFALLRVHPNNSTSQGMMT